MKSRFKFLFLLLPLGWLWFQLINHLRVEWSLNEQYNYGWAVPFLCLYLVWKGGKRGANPKSEIRNPKEVRSPKSEPGDFTGDNGEHGEGSAKRKALCALPLAVLCFLYLPTRLIQEANPEWRLVSWALALEVIGITLVLLLGSFTEGNEVADRGAASGGPLAVRQNWPPLLPSVRTPVSGFRFQVSSFVFPLCFFLVAVPWPTILEAPLIQGLTRATAALTIELLGFAGTPAVQHGNVIEVATGVVGIDEACSGIRSFQATLMLALFFGQLYRLRPWRRLFLVLAGFGLAFVFNVGRTFLLVSVAAAKGLPAIKAWHDPAGVTILVGCFLGLWGVAELLARRQGILQKETKRTNEEAAVTTDRGPGTADQGKAQVSGFRFQVSSFGPWSMVYGLPLAFAAWILFVEIAVEGWYRWHEIRLPAPVAWTVQIPEFSPDFQRLPIAERTRRILRYDDVQNAAWTGPSGSRWQTIYLRWNPGRTAVHLAKNHTPEVCLSSAGRKVISQSNVRWFDAGPARRFPSGTNQSTNAPAMEMKMPFRVYEVTDPTGPLHVFYCLWDDRATAEGAETMMLTYQNRLAPVLAGRRQSGQRSLEVAIWGYAQETDAEKIFRETLPKLVVFE